MKRSISFLFVVLFVQSPMAQAGTVFSLLDAAQGSSTNLSSYWAQISAAAKRRPSTRFIPKLASIREEPEDHVSEGRLVLTVTAPTHAASEVDTKSEAAASLSAVLLAEEHFPTDCLFLTR